MKLVQRIELAARFAEIAQLVEREGKVQEHSLVLGSARERLAILLHGFVVAPLLGESRAQIGAGFDGIGKLLEELFIELDGLCRVSRVESFAGPVIEILGRRLLTVFA